MGTLTISQDPFVNSQPRYGQQTLNQPVNMVTMQICTYTRHGQLFLAVQPSSSCWSVETWREREQWCFDACSSPGRNWFPGCQVATLGTRSHGDTMRYKTRTNTGRTICEKRMPKSVGNGHRWPCKTNCWHCIGFSLDGTASWREKHSYSTRNRVESFNRGRCNGRRTERNEDNEDDRKPWTGSVCEKRSASEEKLCARKWDPISPWTKLLVNAGSDCLGRKGQGVWVWILLYQRNHRNRRIGCHECLCKVRRPNGRPPCCLPCPGEPAARAFWKKVLSHPKLHLGPPAARRTGTLPAWDMGQLLWQLQVVWAGRVGSSGSTLTGYPPTSIVSEHQHPNIPQPHSSPSHLRSFCWKNPVKSRCHAKWCTWTCIKTLLRDIKQQLNILNTVICWNMLKHLATHCHRHDLHTWPGWYTVHLFSTGHPPALHQQCCEALLYTQVQDVLAGPAGK